MAKPFQSLVFFTWWNNCFVSDVDISFLSFFNDLVLFGFDLSSTPHLAGLYL
jgi:hypothetical protein